MTNEPIKRVVPEALVEAAREHGKVRSAEISNRWKAAKEAIEKDIVDNDGLYPYNKGKLDVKEICRRAGISQQTLYSATGPHRSTTLVEIKDWCNSRTATKVPEVRREITGRITELQAELHKVASQIHKYELDRAESERIIRDLRTQNEQLRKQLYKSDQRNVYVIPVEPKR